MGTGASAGKKERRRHRHGDEELTIYQECQRGDEHARECYYDKMEMDIKDGNTEGVAMLFDAWKGGAKTMTAKQMLVDVVRENDDEMLKVFLDHGVHPIYDKNDKEVNPIIWGLRHECWACVSMLVPDALDYDYSRKLLQYFMRDQVMEGNMEAVQQLVDYKIPPSSQVLCVAQLVAPRDKSRELLDLLAPLATEYSVQCNLNETLEHIGWSEFAPIHAACVAEKPSLEFLDLLLEKGVDLMQWGTKKDAKRRHSKRLPLHFAAANSNLEDYFVILVAKANPQALFEPVGAKAGRKLPCQLAEEDRQVELEKLMYKHICKLCDDLKADNVAELFRITRMARLFEEVRTIDTEELSRGVATKLVAVEIQKLIERLQEEDAVASRQFADEASAFALANPRVDLGRETSSKVAVKSIETMGEILKSNFWELLQLVNTAEKGKKGKDPGSEDEDVDVPKLEELLTQEIRARLKWAAKATEQEESSDTTEGSVTTSDTVRYALFLVAGLISVAQSQALEEAALGDTEKGDSDEEVSAKEPWGLAQVAIETCAEDLEKIVGWYCKELQIPSGWNLLDLLKQGLTGQRGFGFVFSAGDLVVKKKVPEDHAHHQWCAGLFKTTFLHIYTRDRHGDDVPERLELRTVEQVFNCGSWGEYAKQRDVVASEVSEKGLAWHEELKTDVVTEGEAPTWHLIDETANEHWLYHGTSLEGETGITEGDFRLNLAGSNAGTLYGNGVYLAEAVSKSDEYTTPHSGGLRSILICLSSLGRVNYNDQKRPSGDELADSCKTGGYHSILGDREKIRGTYREIVLFNENQVYPAYICHYIRAK